MAGVTPDRHREIVLMHVRNRGLEIIPADDTTLQIDIDSDADLEFCRHMLETFGHSFGLESATYTRSKSDRWHVYVKLAKPRPMLERILLQACLGSDRRKEIIHLGYLDRGGAFEPVLFEKPGIEHQPFPFTPRLPPQ